MMILVVLIIYYVQVKEYKKSEYYEQTKNEYLGVITDKGRNGEYRIYKYLSSLEGNKRYLFNIYLPKDDGETTEIDVILLHDSGIYVFESKNYSGWIFGNETQKNWTQTLPSGRGRSQKTKFFNPIMQNKGHIKWLKNYLKDDKLPIFSCIVFSDRCTLKKIEVTSGEHAVINRYNVLNAVRQNVQCRGVNLSLVQIEELYRKLYPLTQVDNVVKLAHIEAVNNKKAEAVSSTSSGKVTSECTNIDEVCPRCGGILKLRTATKGKNKGSRFYGCSNFPKCRYVRDVE